MGREGREGRECVVVCTLVGAGIDSAEGVFRRWCQLPGSLEFMEGRMDIGLDSGLAHIHSKLSDSLKELADKGNQLTDWETQLKEGREKLDEEREELEEERKKIVGREEELEKEKKLMETFSVEEDDVVELNVQGEVMMTLRKTLTQVWSFQARASCQEHLTLRYSHLTCSLSLQSLVVLLSE